jgi:hypothetical protein
VRFWLLGYHLTQVLQRERDKSRQSPRDRPFCPFCPNLGTRPGQPASADRSVPRLLPLGPPSPGTHPASGYASRRSLGSSGRLPVGARPPPRPQKRSDERQGQFSAGQTPTLADPRKCPPGTPTRAGCVPGQDQRSAVPAAATAQYDGALSGFIAAVPPCSQTSAQGAASRYEYNRPAMHVPDQSASRSRQR